ncbi:MAG: hypothetical protein WD830_08230 [Chloroflexota bacterium]
MRFILAAFAAFLLVGCGSVVPAPTAFPTPTPATLPLPQNVSGIPEQGNPNTAVIAAHTPRGELEVGVARTFTLGHCGLMSPIDMDGSLWDPTAAHNGAGGALTEEHTGELINATPTVVVLIDPNSIELRTPLGAVITLTRHDGPRAYFLCD